MKSRTARRIVLDIVEMAQFNDGLAVVNLTPQEMDLLLDFATHTNLYKDADNEQGVGDSPII